MNRNTFSRFSLAPQVDIKRSTFDRSSTLKSSWNVGELIPFFLEEVLPGDEFKVKTSKVVRMQTLKTPVMDNLFLDTYYYFVPNRLIWEHWVNFMGQNDESPWIQQVEYSIPKIEAPSGGWEVGTIADYLGVPTGVGNISINALPFRAVAKCINDWFRDENLSYPLNFSLGDSTVYGSNGDDFVTDVALGGKPYTACKYHDYFTSCLPTPQKGPDVLIPVADVQDLPVITSGSINSYYDVGDTSDYHENLKSQYPLMLDSFGYTTLGVKSPGIMYGPFANGNGLIVGEANSPYRTKIPTGDGVHAGDEGSWKGRTQQDVFNVTSGGYSLTPVNLVAQMNPVYNTINNLRQAFAVQRFLERSARGGSRYIETLKAHFGVTSPDARLQRSEYLGGNRVPLNVQTVVNSADTNVNNQALGSLGAYSQTSDVHYDFDKSFVEHGYIVGFCVARYDHTYQQGLNVLWSRDSLYDFYWPAFSNLGEKAVKNKEIFVQGTNVDDEVFGYQEAWAEYRYKPNLVTGMMRSSANTSLDTWHFADDYEVLPSLSDAWIHEDKTNVDRTLAVSSNLSNQLFADFYIENKATRPMPLYSIPGLIDHN